MSVESCSYKGYEGVLGDDKFFASYAGARIGFGQITVTATSFAAMSFGTPGDLVFTNDDGTSVTLQNIYCIKSVVALEDYNGAAVKYRLILVDAKYMWAKRFFSGRYNMIKPDGQNYFSFSLNGAAVYTLAEILTAIVTAGNITTAAYSNFLAAPTIEPMSAVFDSVDTLSAIQTMLDEYDAYLAYDTINNTVKTFFYGQSNATTTAKIAANASYLIAGGKNTIAKTAAMVPASVDVVFSVIDEHKPETDGAKSASDRFLTVNSTSGRPGSYNSGIKHTIHAGNLLMFRDKTDTFTRAADMISEADYRAGNYFLRFTNGAEYVYNRAIDFNIDEVVSGILIESKDGRDGQTLSTTIRTYNFDPFPMDDRRAPVARLIHESLFAESDKAGTRTIIRSLPELSVESDDAVIAAVDGLVTANFNSAATAILDFSANGLYYDLFKQDGNSLFLKISVYVNGIKYEQIAGAVGVAPAVSEWGIESPGTGNEAIVVRVSEAGESVTDNFQVSIKGALR